MDHLDVVAGAFGADIGAAGLAIDLGRHLGDDRLDAGIGLARAARHHARTFERAFFAARNAHADELDVAFLQVMEATVRVGIERVAAIDDDVARLQVRQQFLDHLIDRLTGLDHDDDGARLGDRGNEFRDRLRRREAAFGAMLVDQFVGAGAVAVEHGDAKALASGVAGEIGAHHGETEHANISELLQCVSSLMRVSVLFSAPHCLRQGKYDISPVAGDSDLE